MVTCEYIFEYIIQLSPEGEVNSGGYIPRREANQMDKKMPLH